MMTELDLHHTTKKDLLKKVDTLKNKVNDTKQTPQAKPADDQNKTDGLLDILKASHGNADTVRLALAYQNRMREHQLDREFDDAFSKFQERIKAPKKDQRAQGRKFGYWYTTLGQVIDNVRNAMKGTDLSFSWDGNSQAGNSYNGSVINAYTVIRYKGLARKLGHITVKTNTLNPQDVGSALTYARRYSLAAAVGLTSTRDNDQNKNKNQNSNSYQSSGNGYQSYNNSYGNQYTGQYNNNGYYQNGTGNFSQSGSTSQSNPRTSRTSEEPTTNDAGKSIGGMRLEVNSYANTVAKAHHTNKSKILSWAERQVGASGISTMTADQVDRALNDLKKLNAKQDTTPAE